MSRIYRLLHVIDHLGSGGAQETLLSLIRYLDRRRFHLEVATLHGQGHYWHIFRQLAVPVYSLSPHKYIPLYLPRLLHLLQTGKFDLIHCHLTASNLIAKPLAAILGVPLIFNYDHNDMYRTQQKTRLRLDRLANLLTDHIIAVSASTRDFLIQQEGVPADKITIIYNGVDLERFQAGPGCLHPGNLAPYLGFAGRYSGGRGGGPPASAKEFPLILAGGQRSASRNSPGPFCHCRRRAG